MTGAGCEIYPAKSKREHLALSKLHAELFTDAAHDHTRGDWWVAWDDGKPIAFAGMTYSRHYKKTGYLCLAGVSYKHRGHGIQKRLIKRRVARAKRLGWDWVVTDTAPRNYASANSLIGCGFKLFKPRCNWADQGSLYWHRRV